MPGNSAGLGVVNLQGDLGSDLRSFDIEKVDVMCCGMDDGKEQHGVCDVSMEPLRAVQWQPSCPGAEPAKEIPAHGQHDDHGIDGQDQARAS